MFIQFGERILNTDNIVYFTLIEEGDRWHVVALDVSEEEITVRFNEKEPAQCLYNELKVKLIK